MSVTRNGSSTRSDQLARARSYLSKMPPSVQGSNGSGALFFAACKVVEFGLRREEALELLLEFNTRCEPPWSEAELRHKLADAFKRTGPLSKYTSANLPPLPIPGAQWPRTTDESGAEINPGELYLDTPEDTGKKKLALAAALSLWNSIKPSNGTHPYAKRKGILPYGARINGADLVIAVLGPTYELQTLQSISGDGTKKFRSRLPAKGGFALIGDRPEVGDRVCLCEGFATGCSIREATGMSTFCALSVGNLSAVASTLASAGFEILVCADLGAAGKRGAEAALDAGAIHAVLPRYPTGCDGSDFNDLHQHSGLDAVRIQIEAARPPDPCHGPPDPLPPPEREGPPDLEEELGGLEDLEQIESQTLTDHCDPGQSGTGEERVQKLSRRPTVRNETQDTQCLVTQEETVLASPYVSLRTVDGGTSQPTTTMELQKGFYSVRSFEDVLDRARVINPLDARRSLFLLARGIKTLETQFGEYTPDRRRGCFDEWRRQNAANISTSEDFLSFMDSIARVKRLLGSDTVSRLWAEVQVGPFPSAADPFDSLGQKRLVAFCQKLQNQWGNEPFPLSCRVLAKLLGHPSHTTAASWLNGLCACRVLKLITPGKRPLANTYRFVG